MEFERSRPTIETIDLQTGRQLVVEMNINPLGSGLGENLFMNFLVRRPELNEGPRLTLDHVRERLPHEKDYGEKKWISVDGERFIANLAERSFVKTVADLELWTKRRLDFQKERFLIDYFPDENIMVPLGTIMLAAIDDGLIRKVQRHGEIYYEAV